MNKYSHELSSTPVSALRNPAHSTLVRTCWVACAFFLGGLPTQTSAQQGLNNPGDTINVRSQIVVLDVVVTDKQGKLVTNLTRDDFKVYENGVDQRVRNFDGPTDKPSLPESAPKDKEGRDDWGNAPLTILVIDALNTPFAETAYSRQQVDRFLKAQPTLLTQPTIVLWLNDAGFHPISAFTRDRDALLSAVDRHKASIPDNYNRGDFLDQLSASLSALQQIALFSRGQKGSKQIIWIGRSFPSVDGTRFSDSQLDLFHKAIRSTLDLLLSSRATIYVIDPTVQVSEPAKPLTNVADPNGIAPIVTKDPFAESFNFKSFVEQTGGEYFYGRNDLNNEISDSINRGTNFYSLSYVPTSLLDSGDYRKIDIHLTNPELIVQARGGYYPEALVQTAASAKEIRFDLYEAIVTGMSYTGVGLRLDQCQMKPDRSEAVCDVMVDNNTLSTVQGPDRSEHSTVTAVITALDVKSKPVANRVVNLGLGLPSRTSSGDMGETKLQVHLALPSTTKTLRILIRDASGRIGSADLEPSEVSQLVKQQKR